MTVQVMQPQCDHDRENIYRFLYEIWSDEFCRSMEGMDHDLRLMKDSLDDTAHHFVAVDESGRILGCVRGNILDRTSLPPHLAQPLKCTEMVDLFGGGKICYASHFAITPDARRRTVASLLIGALYESSLSMGIHVGISYCAFSFVPFYYQLGYRPYAENFRIDVGIRVPIVHCLRDWTYLNEIQSPLARLCARELDDGAETARKIAERFPLFTAPDFSRSKVHHLWARLAHTMPGGSNAKNNSLFTGLSEEERRTVGRWVSEITFSKGEYVYRRGETEQGMGVLLSGSLGVEVPVGGSDGIVSVVLPGEPFGEISSLGGERRTADLVALEKSQAFLIPGDFLERICRTEPNLGLKLTKRLLLILAGRIVTLTDAVISGARAPLFPVRDDGSPSRNQPPGTSHINRPLESYRFESLGDRESEFRRLVTQASIGEDIEFAMLERHGLYDGGTILDLGSGPGITSLLVVKRLPAATVIGVEPEDLLRAKAETLVANQGFAGRCRFLKGTGDRIPLDDGATDFSYARFLFQHLANPMEVLGEMRRVTRRGGRIVILDVDDRTNILHPAPEGMEDLERRIASAQAAAGGDRHVGRKLCGYMHAIGLRDVGVEPIPITASALGREAFFSIVYSFKRQVLERAGEFDEQTSTLFQSLEDLICRPTTFAMTTVFVAHGVVP